MFKRYLDWLHDHFYYHFLRPLSTENPVELILDCYDVHRSVEIRQYAAECFISLWFTPAGHIDGLQPLDRAVFEVLKAIFRQRFEVVRHQSWNQRVTKATAMDILADIWKNVEPKSVHRGRAIYEDDFGPENDEGERKVNHPSDIWFQLRLAAGKTCSSRHSVDDVGSGRKE
jgi:hypothetical protein